MTTERIILSVEIVQDGKDARCSMRVPYANFADAACTGEWFENAIQELRTDCKIKLEYLLREELNAAAQKFMEGMASNE